MAEISASEGLSHKKVLKIVCHGEGTYARHAHAVRCRLRTRKRKPRTCTALLPVTSQGVLGGQERSGRQGDVWSLGCCVLEMGTLLTPLGKR